MQSARHIQAEICAKFGFFPPFFAPALSSPAVLANLWQQTCYAHFECPLPNLFKEKVAALVARDCPVRYCLVCHSSALGGMGLSARKILALMQRPLPSAHETIAQMMELPKLPQNAWPEGGSAAEDILLDCCSLLFRATDAAPVHRALKQYLGTSLYHHLVMLLAYNRTTSSWAEAHPDLPWAQDDRVISHLAPLLAAEPRLALYFAGAHAQTKRQAPAAGSVVSAALPAQQDAAPGVSAQHDVFLQALLDCTPQGIWGLDLNGNLTFINAQALVMLGYTPDTHLVGQNPHALFHHSYADGTPYPNEACPIFQALSTGADVLLENESFWRADGSCFAGEYRSKPVYVDGTLVGAVVSIIDVSERLRAREREQKQQAELVRVLESTNDAYFSVDHCGTIISINSHHERLSGFPREAQMGQHYSILLRSLAPQHRKHIKDALQSAMHTGRTIQFEDYSPTQKAWYAVSIYPKPDGGVAVFSADITARKKAELALEESASKLTRVFASSPAAMALWYGPEFRLELSNPMFAAFFFADPWLGKPFMPLAQSVGHKAFIATLREVFVTGKQLSTTEVRAVCSQEGTAQTKPRHFDCTFVPVSDSSGQTCGVYAHAIDVTERMDAKMALESQTHTLADTIADLHQERDFRDSFVATLTHDLRSPIASAKLKAQMMLRHLKDDGKAAKAINRIVANMDRANRMVENLLDATRIKAGDGINLSFEAGRIDEIVQSVIEDATAQHGARFEVRNHAGPVPGFWDTSAVRRVLENLITNALKYGMPNAPITTQIAAGPTWVDVAVHNEGAPIAKTDQPTLFEPYRRTASAQRSGQKGWGLGLTLVKGITEAHGGEVAVHSAPGEGTTFKVRLPRDGRSIAASLG